MAKRFTNFYSQFLNLSLAVLFLASPTFLFGASFQGLGRTNRSFDSKTWGISSDGSVIVGDGRTGLGDEAFRWTEAGGMVGLGDLPDGVFQSLGRGVSSDGSVVVGLAQSASGQEAFRWTQAGGMVGLGDLPGGIFGSFAQGVSADGLVVVGGGHSDGIQEAFRWTEADGMVSLRDLSGSKFKSFAYGVSSDGSVVVGQRLSVSGYEAFRWTEEEGMVGLGDLPGGRFESKARAISSDGSVIVGEGYSDAGREAFRWTEEEGMVGLGDLPGGDFDSFAFGTSSDGSVIVGESRAGADFKAFIWDATNGMRDLKTVLENDFGLDLGGDSMLGFPGWRLIAATDVSDDGTKIVGWGKTPNGQTEAWLVDLTEVVADPFGGADIAEFPCWKASQWYLNYNAENWPWIYHDEHGWQFVWEGSTEEGIFLWDLGLGQWLFLNESSYRWIYIFSQTPFLKQGWVFTFEDNTPNRRFFQRADDGSLFSVPVGLPIK